MFKENRAVIQSKQTYDSGIKGRAVLVFFLVAFITSCAPKGWYVSEPRDAGVTVQDIVEKPGEYLGKTVTVSGAIKDTFGEQAFTIDGKGVGGELLVVGDDPYPNVENGPASIRLSEEEFVRVTGVIRNFDLAEFERETGSDLEDDRFAGRAGKPAMIVKSLEGLRRNQESR